MGVNLFLHELYPSPLTANKESTAKQTKKGNKREKSTHSPTSIPFSSALNDRYKRSRGPFLMAKRYLATSQGDDSTSEPDNKSKDGSIDPPLNRGDETILRKIKMIILNQSMAVTKGMKLILKFWPTQSAHGPSAPRVANCLGLSPKMCTV